MIWRILPHATVCIASDRLILLDIRQDRYFRVPAALEQGMRAWLDTSAAPISLALNRMLGGNGIAREGDPPATNMARDAVRIPTELFSPIWKTIGPGARFGTVVTAQLTIGLQLRTRSLESILRDHRHVSVARAPIDAPHLEERCAQFARSRIFSPFSRNCLLDTLSLNRWLGGDARDCRIVFGVTAHPFTAHCWLQSPHAVLNDSYDHASRHTPILAI